MVSVLKKKLNNKKGFTLAELLIVVAILAILVAISLPMFNASLDKAKESVIKANLRSVYAEAAVQHLDETQSVDTTDKVIDGKTYKITENGSGDSYSITVTCDTYSYDGETYTGF